MRALDEPTEMDFAETPLKDVVESLKIRYGIEVQLDSKSMTDAGVGADTPIFRTLKGISLRSALRLMLHEHELTFVLQNEALVITTEEGQTEMRQYDVADFVRDGWTIADLVEAVRFALPRPAPGAQGDGPRGSASAGFDQPGRSARRGIPTVALQAAGATPSAADSEVIAVRNLLLVRTTDRGHMDVSNLMAELRHRLETKTE
ncbi:MAG TPA: hypothetical protein VGY55_10190 [Pirellulales bacterium]|nr:hypothetical protein [Pirellulales bacterium]